MLSIIGFIAVNIGKSLSVVTAKMLTAGYAPSTIVVAIRTLVAGLLILGVVRWSYKGKVLGFFQEHWKTLAIGAVFRFLIPFNCVFWAVKYVPIGKVALFSNCKPFITYIMAAVLVGEHMSIKKWTGILVGMSGIIPVLISQETMREQALSFYSILSVPELTLIAAILSISYGWIQLRQVLSRSKQTPAMFFVGAESFIAGIISVPLIFSFGTVPHIERMGMFSLLIAMNIFFGGLVGRNVRAWLLQRYSATLVSLADLLYPFFAVATGWLFFSETIGWELYASTLLVLIGLAIYLHDEARKTTV